MKIRNKFFRFISIGITTFTICLLVISPGIASEAVKEAFSLCAGIILPSLLPFFFISGIISAIGIAHDLASFANKPMNKLFGLSGNACTPLILGLLGGYPVGAATLAELVKGGKISPQEAEKLLPICNNTGPAFIIGAVGCGIFSSSRAGLMLYASHILAAFALASIFSSKSNAECNIEITKSEYCGLITALPGCVKGALDKCLNICGFVIFFSVLSSLLNEIGILSSAAFALHRILGLEPGFCRCLLSGIMELGGGIASMSVMTAKPSSYALAAFILGFGSLSVHCQTLSVVSSAKIKCARHFAGRIIHGVISAILVYVISAIFKI